MSLRLLNCETTTYDFAAGYFVDVVTYPEDEELHLYLHHCYYDLVKMFMFSVRKDELGRYGGAGSLEEIIESSLVHQDYIKKFKEKYSIYCAGDQ